jgi:hypothetical protein
MPQSYVVTATGWNNGTKLCVSGVGGLHLLFQYEYYGPGDENNEIQYWYSPNDGMTWTYMMACSNGYHASMTVNSAGYPHLVRIRWVPLGEWHGEMVIFDSLGTDSLWGSKVCGIGSYMEGLIERPSICVDSQGKSHIAWVLTDPERGKTFLSYWYSDYDQYFWDEIDSIPGYFKYKFPSIWVDWQDQPHIVFQKVDDPWDGIYHTYKDNANWTLPVKINQTSEGIHPCLIRAYTTSMQVVFDGFKEGVAQGVWHQRWGTNEYWHDTDQVCQSQLCDLYPVIGERCVVAWQDLDPGEIWGTRGYYDLGQGEYSFFPPTNISQTSTQSAYPHVAVRGKYAYFAWTEKARGEDPMYDIRVKRMLVDDFNPN